MQNALDRFLSLVPVSGFRERYAEDVTGASYFGFPIETIVRAEEALRGGARSVGYFSMEYGLSTNTYNTFRRSKPDDPRNLTSEQKIFSNLRAIDYYLSLRTGYRLDLPIYSGGLGVLAGDTLKSCADRGMPLAAVGILWNKGYFKQNFWFRDGQIPEENDWDPHSYPGLVPLDLTVEVRLRHETIRLKLWKYFVYAHDQSHVVPLTLLDSNLPENSESARALTGQLYRSDNAEWKILQRVILGIGGMRAFEAMGYKLTRYHLNEGHAALAFVEKARHSSAEMQDLRKLFAYTCHTPVAAGHDRFSRKSLEPVLLHEDLALLEKHGLDPDNHDLVNLTVLAMRTSQHVNAVAQKHGEVTRLQFPNFRDCIQAITNGVHTHTWISEFMGRLFEKYAPQLGDWRRDPKLLEKVSSLKDNPAFRADLWAAHQENKKRLCAMLRHWRVEPDVFTICWARRIAAYKRPSLILQDAERLVKIAGEAGPIQILLAGKAHPKDNLGFTYVNEMLSAIDALDKHRDRVRVLMLENYDTYLGKLLTGGVDVWLNNPLPPFEASGTSGMKAILNGVLQMSTLDGWVVEAEDKDIGWIFGWRHEGGEVGDERHLRLKEDSNELYATLDHAVRLYYETNRGGKADPSTAWVTKMANAIATAGFFNTDRMVGEYQEKIWSG